MVVLSEVAEVNRPVVPEQVNGAKVVLEFRPAFEPALEPDAAVVSMLRQSGHAHRGGGGGGGGVACHWSSHQTQLHGPAWTPHVILQPQLYLGHALQGACCVRYSHPTALVHDHGRVGALRDKDVLSGLPVEAKLDLLVQPVCGLLQLSPVLTQLVLADVSLQAPPTALQILHTYIQEMACVHSSHYIYVHVRTYLQGIVCT